MGLLRWLLNRFRRTRRSAAIWGEYEIPHDLTNRHFFACGTNGTGKTSLLRILERSVLPDIAKKDLDTRALINDPNSEAYSDLVDLGLKDHAVITNPCDARCVAWNMGRDIVTDGQAREVAAVLISTEGGNNKYFYDAARLMASKAMQCLIRIRKRDWDLRDVLLACMNPDDLRILTERANLTRIEPIADYLTQTREAASVRSTLTVEVTAYSFAAAAWHAARAGNGREPFSLTDWVAGRGPQAIVLGASNEYPTALAAINRIFVQRAQQLLLGFAMGNAKTGRRSWVFLDEFPRLKDIPEIERLFTEGRHRGICAVIGFQHIAHMRKVYGRDTATAIVGQCAHQAYFRANDSEMGTWCAEQFGIIVEKDEDGTVVKQFPTLTENDFTQNLRPATAETGFQCIIRSTREVLPSGPKKIEVGPSKVLAGVDPRDADPEKAGFVPWPEEPRLEPWNAEERRSLGLPPSASSNESGGGRQMIGRGDVGF